MQALQGTSIGIRGPNRLLPAVAILLLTSFAVAYIASPNLYFSILSRFQFVVADHPFLDLEDVVTGMSCVHRGFDVFSSNPCSSFGPAGIYSPAWLWIPPLPIGRPWFNFYGVASALAFSAALAGLPRARTWKGAVVTLVVLISPPVLLAAERANPDLLMFAIAMVCIVLMDQSFAFRLVAYVAAEVGALLKYYPLALIALAARERVAQAITIVLFSLLVFAIYVWSNFDLIKKIYWLTPVVTSRAYSVPPPTIHVFISHSELGFGANILTQLVVAITDRSFGIAISPIAVKTSLIVVAFLIALVLARLPAMSKALRSLSSREFYCLIAGSLIICFCFFLGSNFSYRLIFLILVVPGLIAAAETSTETLTGFAWAMATDAVLILTWAITTDLNNVSAGISEAYLIIRETIWWTFVTVLLAALLCFVLKSPTIRRLAELPGHINILP